MLHMACPMLLNAGGKTYPDFEAHILSLSVNAAVTGSTYAGSLPAANGEYRISSPTTGDYLFGTSWGPIDTEYGFGIFAGQLGPALRHALASSAAWSQQSGRTVYVQTGGFGSGTTVGSYTRNGLTSTALNEPEAFGLYRLTDVRAWVDGAAIRMNPSAGTGPTPYTW